MITIQAIPTSLHKATMWLGFGVSGGWLGRSNLECLGGENYFNLEINTNQDNRPKPISDRLQTVEALFRKYKREVQKPSHCT
jgi:hypothetical protein